MAKLKIFHLNRIKYDELWNDALTYIKQTYSAVNEQFTSASPFAQLLSVILHLGRMIFYYIEDSITGLNIRTAYRPDQIKGLATLAGHDAGRPISARGAIRIKYTGDGNNSNDINGVCYIPNKAQIKSKLNGLSYIILLGADTGKVTMQTGNYLDATIIQGELKLQAATGTGEKLQSYNFAERNYQEVDQYYVNVYVNDEPWDIVSSLLDLGYNQKGCIVKTGFNGGIDIFFGNEDMGMCPPEGSHIIVEYIKTDGNTANLDRTYVNSDNYWEIVTHGYTSDGSTINLDEYFNIECLTDIIFGSASEDTALTQTIAPHVSRSMVLANESNYQYFFKKMNMFSDVEIIQGTTTQNNNSVLQLAYDQANNNYNLFTNTYKDMINKYGEHSTEANDAYNALQSAIKTKLYTEQRLKDQSYKDNTVFIYLVPDIKKRISGSQNYFSCDENLFKLTDDEQNNIINMIEESGQKIITVENRIVQPKIARFSVNVYAKIWNGYNEQDVYASGMQVLSDYLLSMKRKDIIPVSDIVSLFENKVDGIDSVKVSFDADLRNESIYGKENFYGIDEYGDIILSREIMDNYGNIKKVKDILPLIRGGFTSSDGIEYSREQSYSHKSAYNLIITDVTNKRNSLLTNYSALT